MQKLSTLADDLWPFLIGKVQRVNGNGGGRTSNGGSSSTPGSTTLAALTDVALGTLVDDQVLTYDSTTAKWINQAPGVGGGGTYVAGNGIAIVSTTISTKHKSGGGLYADPVGSAILLDSNSGLDLGVAGLKMATPGTLTVTSANTISSTDHQHAIAAESDVTTPTVHSALLKSGSAGDLTLGALTIKGNLTFSGSNRQVLATDNLKLAPTIDLQIDPGGVVSYADGQESRTAFFQDSVTGIIGFQLADWSALPLPPGSLGGNSMGLKLNYLKVDNLFARKFTADEVRVQRGEWWLTRSFGIVEHDFIVPNVGATVDVWFEEAPGLVGKLFLKDNWIQFRTIDMTAGLTIQSVFFQIVDADASGVNDYIQRLPQDGDKVARQQWRLIRRSGGFTGAKIAKGEVGADVGQPRHEEVLGSGIFIPDQGVVYATSLFDDDGPFIQTQTFDHVDVAGAFPVFKNRTRMGNLKSVAGYTTEIYGFAAADDLSQLPSSGLFSGMTVDYVNGLRMYNTDIELREATTIALKLSKTYGITLLNDDVAHFHNLRNIAWYDSLNNLATANPTAKISSSGLTNDIRLTSTVYGVTKAAHFIEARGSAGADSAMITVKGGLWEGPAGGWIDLSANYVTQVSLNPHFRIGGDAGAQATSNLHVYSNDGAVNEIGGVLIQQAGSSGDALLHFQQGTGATAFTMGIDHADGKLYISAGMTLHAPFLIFNPVTGSTTINGVPLTGSPVTGLIAGPGIALVGSNISVNNTVVRTDRTITAGDGMAGGGDLSANRAFAVDGTVVRTSRLINTAGALAGGGNLGATLNLALTLAAVSGLNQTAGLAINDSLAGAGLTMTAKVLSVTPGAFVATSVVITAGDGLNGGGPLSSDITIDVDSTVVRTTRSIATTGALAGGGTLAADRSLALTLATPSGLNQTAGLALDNSVAGLGLLMTGKVLSVDTTFVVTSPGTVVRSSRLIQTLPGSGLSGGGDLSADLSLTLDFSAVARATVNLIAGLGLTGGGNLTADRTFNVGAGNGITVNADDVAVNLGYAFAWTGAQTWAGGSTFNGAATFNGAFTHNSDVLFTGTRTISSNSTNDLVIAPGGDLILSPTGQDVLPTSTYVVDLGDYNRKWRSLFVAEIYAETLVSQSVMATIGGRVMVSPSSLLVADLGAAVGDTTIHLKHNSYTSGSYLMLEGIGSGGPQFEILKITSAPSGAPGDYTYTVERDKDGSGRTAWYSGDSVTSFAGAAVGDGFIDLTSTRTAMNHLGPTITIYARTATTNWNDVKPVVTLGNLDSFLGYGTEYGTAAGNDLTLPTSSFSGYSIDRTNGMRLYNTQIQLWNGGVMSGLLSSPTGLAFKVSAWNPSSIGWWDHIDVPGDFTDTNLYGAVSHYLNAPHSILNLQGQARGGYTKGGVRLTGYNYPSGTMALEVLGDQVGISNNSTYGSYNIARFTAGAMGINGATPTSPYLYFMRDLAPKAFIGSEGAAGGLISGSAVDDLAFRTAGGKMLWSVDNGAHAALVLSANDKVTINKNNSSDWALQIVHNMGAGVAAQYSLQQWAFVPTSYDLGLYADMSTSLVRYKFALFNAGTLYNDILTFDRGAIGFGMWPNLNARVTFREDSSMVYAAEFVNQNNTRTWGIKIDRDALNDGSFSLNDVTAGLARLSIDIAGNVGIGIVPGSPLDVYTGAAAGLNPIRLFGGNVTGEGPSIRFMGAYNLSALPDWRLAEIGAEYRDTATYNGGNLIFKVNDDSGATPVLVEKMRLSWNGILTVPAGVNFGQTTIAMYQEATNSWTPTLSASTTNPTLGTLSQIGDYTRVGNVCHFQASINWNAHTAGSGWLRLTIPFAGKASRSQAVSVWLNHSGGSRAGALSISAGSTTGAVYFGSALSNAATDMGSLGTISYGGTYYI